MAPRVRFRLAVYRQECTSILQSFQSSSFIVTRTEENLFSPIVSIDFTVRFSKPILQQSDMTEIYAGLNQRVMPFELFQSTAMRFHELELTI